MSFTFQSDWLQELSEQLAPKFATASPFPHVVVDNFLPPEVLEPVLKEFPEPVDADWQRYDTGKEVKLALDNPERMGHATRHLLSEFNGHVFVDFLERLTGIEALLPDPHLYGGGLHQIRTGGYLKIHADFNQHRRLHVHRRLNGLLYLNRDWSDDWGGHLELWDRDMSRCVHKIAPVFNRLVIFSTTDHSNHGHPDPLRCPSDRSRRSMALYYYTARPPEGIDPKSHSTLFHPRPDEDIRGTKRQMVKGYLKPWIPPAAYELRSRLRRG